MDFRTMVGRMRVFLAPDATVSAGILMLARAADALDPGQLDWDGTNITHRGARLYLASGQLGARLLRVPGVALYLPTETAGDDFTLDAAQLAAWSRPYVLGDLPSLIGSRNAAVVRALDALWRDRMAPMALVDVDRVRLVLAAGVMVVPATVSILRGLGVPEDLAVQPGDGWIVAVAEFRAVMDAYRNGNVDLAAELAANSNASAERWARVEAVVEAVRDLPATIATEAIKAPFRILGSLGMPNLLLVGAAGVGLLLWFNRGAVARHGARLVARAVGG